MVYWGHMAAHPPVISVSSVAKQFGKFAAVSDVSFDISAGEVIGFVGVNGAGKTTTINMLLGFTSPTKGSVSLFGKRVKPANAHVSHQGIGFASGDMELPVHLTGRQYIDFVLGQTRKDHAQRLPDLTERFVPQLDKKISTLSRGNKQKIALVAAFVTEPTLVILDEPTSGLDPVMQAAFLDLVREERERGTTIFMSSHYLQEVAEVCTRVLLMRGGRIIKDLSAKELESASGKSVRVVSKHKLRTLPPRVVGAEYSEVDETHVVVFVYYGPTAALLRWLTTLHDVIDFDVSERTLDAAFHNLYADNGGQK